MIIMILNSHFPSEDKIRFIFEYNSDIKYRNLNSKDILNAFSKYDQDSLWYSLIFVAIACVVLAKRPVTTISQAMVHKVVRDRNYWGLAPVYVSWESK